MPYNFVPDSFHTAVRAKVLRAKIDRQSAILHQRGHFATQMIELCASTCEVMACGMMMMSL